MALKLICGSNAVTCCGTEAQTQLAGMLQRTHPPSRAVVVGHRDVTAPYRERCRVTRLSVIAKGVRGCDSAHTVLPERVACTHAEIRPLYGLDILALALHETRAITRPKESNVKADELPRRFLFGRRQLPEVAPRSVYLSSR